MDAEETVLVKNGQIPCLHGAQTLKGNTVLNGGKGLGALMPIIGEFKVRKSFPSKPTHELKSERRVDWGQIVLGIGTGCQRPEEGGSRAGKEVHMLAGHCPRAREV